MRRLLLACGFLAFCSVAWAQDLDVNAWATFTSTNAGYANRTETLDVSFLYNPQMTIQDTLGSIVGGTLSISGFGFLGAFTGPTGNFGISLQGDIPFFDAEGDEIDLRVPINGILAGVNTTNGFDLFNCLGPVCSAAFPGTNIPRAFPTSEGSIASAAVPDGTGFVPMSLAMLGALMIAWRWRRKEATAAARES